MKMRLNTHKWYLWKCSWLAWTALACIACAENQTAPGHEYANLRINLNKIVLINVNPATNQTAGNHRPTKQAVAGSAQPNMTILQQPPLTKVPSSVGSAAAAASVASSPSPSSSVPAPDAATPNRDHTLDIARRLESRLKAIRNDDMCITEVQEMFDFIGVVQVPRNDADQVHKIAAKLEGKMRQAVEVLRQIETAAMETETRSKTVVYPCPARIPSRPVATISYNRDQIEILNNNVSASPAVDDFSGKFYRRLKGAQFPWLDTITMATSQTAATGTLNIKRKYLLSPHDNAIDNSCPFYFDTQPLRKLFVSSIPNKQVLILLDHGNSLSADLDLTKAMAKNVIGLLTDTDTVNIIAISDKVTPFLLEATTSTSASPKSGSCDADIREKMHNATVDNRLLLNKYIDSLNKTKEHTNHSLGFQAAFEFIRREIEPADEIIFLYISRGLLSMPEAKTVLETIAGGQERLQRPVVINTCAIIIDEKRIMYERQFLRDIAVQDYGKYGVDTAGWLSPGSSAFNLTGQIYSVSKQKAHSIFVNATGLFSKYYLQAHDLDHKIHVHLPYIDTENRETLFSVSRSLPGRGVIGVDLYLKDLAEDVIYYSKHPDSYAFLVNVDGLVLVHPTLEDKMHNKECLFPTDILYLEQNRFFDRTLRAELLTHTRGESKHEDATRNGSVTYTWQRTADGHFIVCIVTWQSKVAGRQPVSLKRFSSGTPDILYHRLDLFTSMLRLRNVRGSQMPLNSAGNTPAHKVVGLCRNFKQISTFDSGTLYLSPSAFQSPFSFVQKNGRNTDEEVALDRIQTLMAYLKDQTPLLANPGLLPQVRNDVVALSYVIEHLKRKHMQEGGPHRKYIIRRYVATMNGVLEVFPGMQLAANLEPMQRPWFIKAMQYPGRIVITEPYLDAGGAGYICSIAYTIFEGKANALHNPERDLPVAVLAIDVTMGFLYKTLLEANAVCGQPNIKCFLSDDKGYLVAHPSILEPPPQVMTDEANGPRRRPLEHVTHRESFVANDILNHKVLVQKRLCNVYANRTTQRYYQFNTSMSDVLTNIVNGEKSKYHITLVPGTNVFVTVVNSSSNGGDAFCPCSTVDRLCLNCNRMEQTECECPCECPLLDYSDAWPKEVDATTTGCQQLQQRNETLTQQNCDLARLNLEQEHYHLNTLMPIFRYDFDEIDMKSCSNQNCEQFATHLDCLGVIGCEWCQVDVDGETVFGQPFCTAQASCFGGILGSVTPYGLDLAENQLGATIFVDPLRPPTYSSIGPIAGAMITLCLVVGFAMYCYRQNQDPHQVMHFEENNYYIDSMADNNFDVPLNRIQFEDAPFDDEQHDGNSSNQNLIPVNNGAIVPAEVSSPYRAPSAYRRRPNADSDHGYSTMTPHDDSENLCFTLADPLPNAGQKRASISDSASINTSVSSPTNYQRHYNVPLDNKTILGGSSSIDLRDTAAAMLSGVHHSSGSPHHVLLAPVTVHRQMEAS